MDSIESRTLINSLRYKAAFYYPEGDLMKRAAERIDELDSNRRHCVHCGGTWIDDGINSDCQCLKIKALEAERDRLLESLPYVWGLESGQWFKVPVVPDMVVWVLSDPVGSGRVVEITSGGFEVKRPRSISFHISGSCGQSKNAAERMLRGN